MDRLRKAMTSVAVRRNRAIAACSVGVFLAAGAANAQTVVWSHTFDSAFHGDDLAVSVAVNAVNDVFVLADSKGPNGYDWMLIKYDTGGTRQWAYRLDGPAHKNDRSTKVLIDGDGNVVMVGYTIAGNGYPNLMVAKVSPSGNFLWSRVYDDPSHGPDYPWDMAIDNTGSIYVAGTTYTTATKLDYMVVKYDDTGNRQWLRRYAGAGGFRDDEATAVSLDTAQNVAVTGYSYNATQNTNDFVTSKYSPTGNLLWRRRLQGASANASNYPSSIVTDGSNNVVVFGTQVKSITGKDWQFVKYDPTGKTLWQQRYNDGYNGNDVSRKVVTDANGNIFATGTYAGSGGYPDWMTMKLSPTGTRLWLDRYTGTGGRDDVPNDIIVDAGSNVIVTGFAYGTDADYDCVTIKYLPNGPRLWVDKFGSLNRSQWGTALALDSLSNILVAGSSSTTSTDGDVITIKYKP